MQVDMKAKLKAYAEVTEKYIGKYFNTSEGIPHSLAESIMYSIRAGGKRLRPALLLGTYEIFSDGNLENAIPFAASIEMIHTYSLIHDDLPAMDDDDLRRGKPSNHVVYGEAGAILAGDALLNSAVENMLKSLSGEVNGRMIKATSIIMDASGPAGMIGGQVLDMDGATGPGELERIHAMKTGALIKAAVIAGGVLGGCTSEDERILAEYAENLGFAFQVKDDILDVEGDADILGKPIGSDFRNEKSTFVTFHGLEKAKEALAESIFASHAALDKIDGDTVFLHDLAAYIADRKG